MINNVMQQIGVRLEPMGGTYLERLSVALGLLVLLAEGVISCSSDSPSSSKPRPDGGVAAADEPCGNGMDDDGDGVIDEGCPCAPGDRQDCFGGSVSARNRGVCKDGTMQCQVSGDSGSWAGACIDAVLPGAETCNGLDDDCDGTVDEGCPCSVGGERRSCGAIGLPLPCRAGEQVCGPEAVWSDCEGEVLPAHEACNDGVDNDCDGRLDEDCQCAPSPEVCGDGFDNDCDGLVDEECDGGGGDPGPACECPTDWLPSSWQRAGLAYSAGDSSNGRGWMRAAAGAGEIGAVTRDGQKLMFLRFDYGGGFVGSKELALGPLPDYDPLGGGMPISDLLWTGQHYVLAYRPADGQAKLATFTSDGTVVAGPVALAFADSDCPVITLFQGHIVAAWRGSMGSLPAGVQAQRFTTDLAPVSGAVTVSHPDHSVGQWSIAIGSNAHEVGIAYAGWTDPTASTGAPYLVRMTGDSPASPILLAPDEDSMSSANWVGISVAGMGNSFAVCWPYVPSPGETRCRFVSEGVAQGTTWTPVTPPSHEAMEGSKIMAGPCDRYSLLSHGHPTSSPGEYVWWLHSGDPATGWWQRALPEQALSYNVQLVPTLSGVLGIVNERRFEADDSYDIATLPVSCVPMTK